MHLKFPTLLNYWFAYHLIHLFIIFYETFESYNQFSTHTQFLQWPYIDLMHSKPDSINFMFFCEQHVCLELYNFVNTELISNLYIFNITCHPSEFLCELCVSSKPPSIQEKIFGTCINGLLHSDKRRCRYLRFSLFVDSRRRN